MNTEFSLFRYGWNYNETICGWGSTIENTKNILQDLPIIFSTFNINSVNDAGCGDLWWIRRLKSKIDYVGYDLYKRASWNKLDFRCEELDIYKQKMRKSDLIICRDVFIHWPNEYIQKTLKLFRETSRYLYSTTYTGECYEFYNDDRIEKCSIHHCKLNLCSYPFLLGKPIYITTENYRTQCCQKLICLWEL